MFTWAMATVVAHECCRPWIQVLTYGAAFAVTTSRLLARGRRSSDMWVGSALGIGIAEHVSRSLRSGAERFLQTPRALYSLRFEASPAPSVSELLSPAVRAKCFEKLGQPAKTFVISRHQLDFCLTLGASPR